MGGTITNSPNICPGMNGRNTGITIVKAKIARITKLPKIPKMRLSIRHNTILEERDRERINRDMLVHKQLSGME